MLVGKVIACLHNEHLETRLDRYPERCGEALCPLGHLCRMMKERRGLSTNNLVRSVPKHLLSRRVECLDDSVGCRGDDGISGMLHNRFLEPRHLEELVAVRTEQLRQAKEGADVARREAEHACAAAKTANQAKSVFLANMSHELRTPLNAVLGFSDLMLRDTNFTKEQRQSLETIGRSGEHLLALINDVLEIAKIESGRIELRSKPFDLHNMLLGLQEMFRLRAEQKDLSLVFERSTGVPQFVLADQNKLRQVLINLLGNAVKFTSEGGVVLRVLTLPSEPKGNGASFQLVFEIEDTGPGICDEDMSSIFEAFVQTECGRGAREGTGLGLPISRQYVELMNGCLTVSSQVGRGSVFRFNIPTQAVDELSVNAQGKVRRVLSLEPDQPEYRLLVGDDRESNRQLLVKLLQPLGFELREATNGLEAIKIWKQWSPHLIWMDMRMPVLDGCEATRRIKATTKGQATVIIAITASALEEERTVILSAGCDDFVRKPFREVELFDALQKHIGVRFVFEESEQDRVPSRVPTVLSATALAVLPQDLLRQLYDATISLDMEGILTAVDQIRLRHPSLAQAILDLADSYDYEQISTVTGEAISDHE